MTQNMSTFGQHQGPQGDEALGVGEKSEGGLKCGEVKGESLKEFNHLSIKHCFGSDPLTATLFMFHTHTGGIFQCFLLSRFSTTGAYKAVVCLS